MHESPIPPNRSGTRPPARVSSTDPPTPGSGPRAPFLAALLALGVVAALSAGAWPTAGPSVSNPPTGPATPLWSTPAQAPSLSIADAEGFERNRHDAPNPLAFVVTVTGDREEDVVVTVDYTTESRTARQSADASCVRGLGETFEDARYRDYVSTSGTLTFAADVFELTIHVPSRPDVTNEADETFAVILSDPVNAALGDGEALGTLWNDDDVPVWNITEARSAPEDDPWIHKRSTAFRIHMMGDAEAASVAYTVTDITSSPSDYGNHSGVLSHTNPPECNESISAVLQSIYVYTVHDKLIEPDEQLTLTLSDPQTSTLGDEVTADAWIYDDDDAHFSITDVTGREDAGDLLFEVTRSDGIPLETMELDYASADGSATAGLDYTGATGTLSFETDVGDTVLTIAVPVLEDEFGEGNETFTVTLSNPPPRAILDKAVGIGTIIDDEVAPPLIVLSASPPRISEGDDPRQITVTASLDGDARDMTTTVDVTVRGANGPDAVDFDEVPAFEIEIPAGETSAVGAFTLTPVDDEVDEVDERLLIEGTSDLPVSPTHVTLADDDERPRRVNLSASPARVAESDGATLISVSAVLDGAARTVVTTITLSVADSGDPLAVDYAPLNDFDLEIDIPAGETGAVGSFRLIPEDDQVDEVDETLTLFGVSDLPVTSATVTLFDDDEPSDRIELSAVPSRVSEGAGDTVIAVTAGLNRDARATPTIVQVSASGSGEPAAVDFAPIPGFEIVIPAGETDGTMSFTLMPEDDEVSENEETIDLNGTADLPVSPTTVALTDDDAPSTTVALSAVPSRISEGDGATVVNVTASLNGAARTVLTTITVAVVGTGRTDAVDFDDVPDFEIRIEAGEATGTGAFTLVPEDDRIDELDETLNLSGRSDLSTTGATVMLLDDDETSNRIALSASPARISEGDGPTAVQVTATMAAAARLRPTEVVVSVSGSGVPQAVDFQPVATFTIDIGAGATRGFGTFTLTPEDDHLDEEDEMLAIVGTADLDVSDTAVVLVDDDETTTRIILSLSARPARISEGAGPTPVTVNAHVDGAARAVSTMVTVAVDGTGTADAVDFEPVADFFIDIPAGAFRGAGVFDLIPEDDRLDEVDEALSVSGETDLPVVPATLALIDNDPVPMLAVRDSSGVESSGEVAFEVTLGPATDAEVTVGYVTQDATGAANLANSGEDYEVTAGTLTFAPGATVSTIRVPVVDDAVDEPAESFLLVLTDPVLAELADASATGTIRDDDEAPAAMSIADGAAPESGGELMFVVSLDGTRASQVFVDYATVDGTASAGADYDAVSGTLVFEPGERTVSIAVPLLDDALDEPDESFVLLLSNPVGADLTTESATGTIHDDDEAPTLSVGDAEGGEDIGDLVFDVVLSAASARTVTLRYATADRTATSGDDYRRASGTLTFVPGQTVGSIRVAVVDDALHEPDETFELVLSDPTAAVLATPSAAGTIRDDDDAPTLSVGDAEGGEDIGDLIFDVVLSAASARTVTLRYATADRTATSDEDYRRASGTLTFVPGDTAGSIRVAVIDDSLHEPDETLELVLSEPTAAVLATPSAVGTIRDDDDAPTLSVGDAEGGEDIGDLVFDVVLSAASTRTVTLRYATADRTATSDEDYRRASGTLTFVPGDTAGSIRVAVIDDSLHEPDETFELVLSEPTAAELATPSAVGTIRDDDDAPTLSVGDAEGGEDIGDLVFDVVLSAASARTVTLRYATADRTATSDEDYRRASGTLTFVPGDTAGSIRVAVIDDSLHEPDETLELVLSEPTAAVLATPSAVGTIRDDDDAPTLSVGDAEGGEDIGDLVFDVVLSAASARTVTLRYATADRTATSDEDYRRASGTLTFVPGDTAGSIRVAVIDDSLREPDETFELVLSEPTAAVLATPSATGTIHDDDLSPPAPSAQLPDVLLCVGGAAHEADLASHFSGDPLTFSVLSSGSDVAAVTLVGSALAVEPVSEGEMAVTVTAVNEAGEARAEFAVRVVTDPTELAALDGAMASIGRGILAGAASSIDARFQLAGERTTDRSPGSSRWDPRHGTTAPVHGTRSADPGALPFGSAGPGGPLAGGEAGHGYGERQPSLGFQPFPSFSVSLAGPGPSPSWSIWGRGETRRNESDHGRFGHEGRQESVLVGVDRRSRDWLVGIVASRHRASVDYHFLRSFDACGDGGTGTGMLRAELTALQPYAGRQLGSGWLWGTAGAGRGEAVLERCDTGRTLVADLSMRLAAAGGRHPIARGRRIEVSVVEDLGVLELKTGHGLAPLGGERVSVGRARLGIEVAGSLPPDCPLTLSTYAKALARGDWGDGDTGAGMELAVGARLRDQRRRLGIDADVHALVAHSTRAVGETGASVTVSLLPRPDGTGLRLAVSSFRQGIRHPSPAWGPLVPDQTGVSGWRLSGEAAFGFLVGRGLASPFVEHRARHNRLGLRYAVGRSPRGLRLEWTVGHDGRPSGHGVEIRLLADARF